MAVEDAARLARNVGRRVMELRVRRGLTQQALADRLGSSLRYVQRVEAGDYNFTLESLVRLGNTLGAPAGSEMRPLASKR